MKKITTITLALSLSLFAISQKKDSLPPKKDSVYIPMYEKTDTLRRSFYYNNGDGIVRVAENGYILVKGFSVSDKKPYQWASDPKILFALDEKKRPVKKVLQIF